MHRSTSRSDRGAARAVVVGVVAVVTLGVVGGGALAAYSFLNDGPQAASVFPESTVAFAEVDLDPGGGQKLAAYRTLKKFPAIEDQLNLKSEDDDIMGNVVNLILEEAPEGCQDLTYEDDFKSWLGSTAGAGLVPNDENGDAVLALEVKDEDAATATLETMRECGAGSDEGAFEFRDGFVVLTEDTEAADRVTAATDEATLADSAPFIDAVDDAGGDGFLTAYLSAEAAPLLAEAAGEQLREDSTVLESFEGGAAVAKFSDAGLQIRATAGLGEQLASANDLDSLVDRLPTSTTASVMFAGDQRTADEFRSQFEAELGGGTAEMFEQAFGVSTDDLATLLSAPIAIVAGSLDMQGLNAGVAEGSELAIITDGDPGEYEDVADKLRGVDPLLSTFLASDTEGNLWVAGPSEDFRSELINGDGGLTDTDTFKSVVQLDDLAGLLYLDFNEFNIDDLSGGAIPDDVADNLAPLRAAAIAGTAGDDGRYEVEIRISTN